MSRREPDEMARKLGHLLARAREDTPLSQRRFAELAGLCKRTVSNAESGAVNVRVETVYAYLRHTDLTIDDVWREFHPPKNAGTAKSAR